MLKKIISEKPIIHNRNIGLATYPHKESEIVVEGTLIDKREKKFLILWEKLRNRVLYIIW
ncbi:MAG: hypothetical protein DRH26_00865 [Deltaproteobacteria bacterium]|nr:MAG: hypothetical protein DRH26_00865 [Deltaproteobacteria bacterium]